MNTSDNIMSKKHKSKYDRISLRFDCKEQEKISKVMTGIENENVILPLNKLFKFIIRELDADGAVKKIVKLKKQKEEIQRRAESEIMKIWF